MDKDALKKEIQDLNKKHKLDELEFIRKDLEKKIDSGISATAICQVLKRNGVSTTPKTLKSWLGR